jgi:two-component system, NtrC family, sensor kinase
MTPADGPLALLGSVAKLLTAGLGTEATVAAVAETLRTRLPAAGVTVWIREPGTTAFRPVAAPMAPDAITLVSSLAEVPLGPGRRFVLEHETIELGLMEVVFDDDDTRLATLGIVADMLSPYLAAAELSTDLAGEVAEQSREIEEHRRFTGLIIDSLPVGLYVVDRDYRITTWNRKRETGTQGLRRDAVVGRPVFEVLTRQPAAQLRADFDRVFRTGEIQQREIEVSAGGDTRFYRLSKIPMRLEGDDITHVITIGEDVTERQAIQSQIAQSEKLAAVGQLAAGVMHEINNPLATISACVAAIQGRLQSSRAGGEAVGEYLEMIDKEVERCTRIVDGLLDFSRPKAKAKGPVSLNRLVADTLFLVKHHPRFKHLHVIQKLDATEPVATGNAEQLTQMLLALTLNAVDAMEEGGTLTLKTSGGRGRPDEVLLEVEDTGVGIPRAEQGKIFEPFYTTKPPGRGTGLGLSICYGIVEEHSGRIEVDSAPDRGSIFRVYLPVSR